MRAIHESSSAIGSSESWPDTSNSYSWSSWGNEILIREHRRSSLPTRWSSSMKARSFYDMLYFLLQKEEVRSLWTSQLMKSKSMTEAFERWSKCSCSQGSQCRCNHLNWWSKSACSHETDDWGVVAIIKLMIEEFMQFRMNMTESFLIRSLNVALAWDRHSLGLIGLDSLFSLFITSSMCLIFSCSLHFFSSACFVVSSLILQNTFDHWPLFSALLAFCYTIPMPERASAERLVN